MRVTVQSFARLKDFFRDEIHLDLAEESTMQTVFHSLAELNPKCRDILTVTKIAVNEAYVDLSYKPSNDSRILLFPPSSGG